VQPTMAEEIKFGAEKMGTAGPTATLHEFGAKVKENVAVGTETVKEVTESVKQKSAQLWTETQAKVQEVNEIVKENLEFGWQKVLEATEAPGPLHEIGARVGLVQPTMSEEIKMGAEKMGTAGPTAKLHEMTETVKEKGLQLNESVKENLEFGRRKVMEATETPGPLHEIGARVGLVQPTMTEEIKFGAEKMGTAGPTAKLHEMKENVQEKGAQVWTGTQEKVQEYNEKIKENLELGKEKVKEITQARTGTTLSGAETGPTRIHLHLHDKEKMKEVTTPTVTEEITLETEKKRETV